MNKFLILWIIVFVFFLIGGYIFNQNVEKPNVVNRDVSIEIVKSNKQNVNSVPTIAKKNTSESIIPLENRGFNHHATKNDSQSSIATTTHKPELNTSKTQTPEQEKVSLAQSRKQNGTPIELPLKQNEYNSPRKITHLPSEQDSSQKLHLTFMLLNETFPNKTKRITVKIPIKTHTGLIDEYTYSAKLENGQFSLTWETPNWFQLDKYTHPIKDVQFTYNSIISSNFSVLEEISPIKLYKMLPIELTFETSDRTLIPDKTKIKFFEKPSVVEIFSPFIMNQKGTIYIEPENVSEIKPMSIGQYFSEAFFVDSKAGINLARTIQLKKKVLFKAIILDQKQQPLFDHFVVFSKSQFPSGLSKILDDYEKKGVFDETKFASIYKIDSFGEINGETDTTGKYFVTVFGPKIKRSIFENIIIPADGEAINIQVEVSTAEIKINFLENGQPFLGELNGRYSINNFTGNFFRTKTGFLKFSNLQGGKLELHLISNVFINTTIQFIIPEEGTLEKDIDLKPGAFLSGTLTTNNKPIIGKNLSIYLKEKGNASYDHNTQSDQNGHFQFNGLNPEMTYIFQIDLENYLLDPIVSAELRASDQDVLINLIEKFEFVGLVYDETGSPIKINNVAKSIMKNNIPIRGGYPRIEKNKFTIALDIGDTISLCIQAKDFANHYQTIVFEPSLLSKPLVINLKKGILVKGLAFDISNKPIFAGLIVEAILFEFGHFPSNEVDVHGQERTALGAGGTFQIENAQIGERYYVLNKDNSPIPFTIEEKHRHEIIELKTTKSYSFSGNLRSQKNVLQEGRRVKGERAESKEYVLTYVDAKGNFFINCLRPGKWVFTSNFRDMHKVVPRIEIEIIDKDETYDWVVFR